MSIRDIARKDIEGLLDFTQFTISTLNLYGAVQSSVTRQLLCNELYQRLRRLNGAAEIKCFEMYLTPLNRLLNELSAHPEHIDAGIELAEELMVAIDRMLLSQLDGRMHEKPE